MDYLGSESNPRAAVTLATGPIPQIGRRLSIILTAALIKITPFFGSLRKLVLS